MYVQISIFYTGFGKRSQFFLMYNQSIWQLGMNVLWILIIVLCIVSIFLAICILYDVEMSKKILRTARIIIVYY